MEVKSRRPFSNLKSWKWQNVILLALMTFYLTNFGFRVANYRFPAYGQDYLAFWSAGKVADTAGYSRIYDLDNLRAVESQEMINLGLLNAKDDPNFLTIPAPYLSIFIIPFQFLSRIEIQTSTSIWLMINFMIMIAYLLFFYRDLRFTEGVKAGGYSLLLLVLFSYPVFDNFLEGQINVFLMICVGEFLRNSVKGRPFISGLWLAGLLLKPQLLVVLMPLILILGYWNVVKGFLGGSVILLTVSWLLSGADGLRDLFFLLIGYTHGIATNSPQFMINWRMIGVNLNFWTHSSFGWIVTVMGMLVTLGGVAYLARRRQEYGSSGWLLLVTGAFSATIAVTWHAHNHIAMVMVPLLLAAYVGGIVSRRTLNFWVLTPPAAWIVIPGVLWIMGLLFHFEVNDLLGMVIVFSGFGTNLFLFTSLVLGSRSSTIGMNVETHDMISIIRN